MLAPSFDWSLNPKDRLVEELMEVCDRLFEEMNRGELESRHGYVELSKKLASRRGELLKILNTREPERNDPCICGSGKKYKKCCMKNTKGSERLY